MAGDIACERRIDRSLLNEWETICMQIFDKKARQRHREREAHLKTVKALHKVRAESIVDCMWEARDASGETFAAVNLDEFYQIFTRELQHVHGEYRSVHGTGKFEAEMMRFVDEQKSRIITLVQKRFKTNAGKIQWMRCAVADCSETTEMPRIWNIDPGLLRILL